MMVERKLLAAEIAQGKVQITVFVEVRRINAHAAAGLSVVAFGDAGAQGSFFPFSPAAIQEQPVRQRVVGYEEVHPAIAVDVRGHHSQGLALHLPDDCLMANLAESPVTVVMVEQAGQRLELGLQAIKTLASEIETLVTRVCRVIDVVADEQVEPAVIVIVEPGSRTRPSGINKA